MTESGSEFTQSGWELHSIPGQGREAWKGGLGENQGLLAGILGFVVLSLGRGAHF